MKSFKYFSGMRFYPPLVEAYRCLAVGWQRLPCTYTVAKISAGIGVGYSVFLVGRMIWKRRCIDSFSSDNLPFKGDARQPLCAKCTPTIADGLDAGKGWIKLVTIKTRCYRCCRLPQLYAKDKDIKVTICDEIHRSVNMYSCLQLGRDRDTHGPMETVLDNLPNHDKKIAVLMNIIGNLCTSEYVPRTFFGFWRWNEHTNSYMMATPWKPVVAVSMSACSWLTGDNAEATISESSPATLNPPENVGRRCWSNFQHVASYMRPYWEWVFSHD
jgi:hypothetical protein